MKRNGIIIVEALAALAVIVVVTGVLAQISLAYLRSRNDFMLERTLRLAAQAQLDRCRAGVPSKTPVPEGLLPPDVQIATAATPGDGPWTGMTRVTVTASGKSLGGRAQTISISGFFAEAPKP